MTACPATTYVASKPQPCLEPAGRTPLCDDHLTRAGRAVPLLIYDYRDLEQLLPRSVGQNLRVDRSTPNLDPPIPLRLDVEELQRRIYDLALAWAEVLSDRHNLSDRPVNVRDGYALLWAVRIITPRTEVLVRIPAVQMVDYPHQDDEATRLGTAVLSYVAGAQGLLHLADAHQKARSMLGLTEPVYELPGHCQSRGCGRPALRVKAGEDTVWCERCGAVMTRDDYDRYGNLFLREAA